MVMTMNEHNMQDAQSYKVYFFPFFSIASERNFRCELKFLGGDLVHKMEFNFHENIWNRKCADDENTEIMPL